MINIPIVEHSMNLSYLLAKRITYSDIGNKSHRKSNINIATFGIAVGLSVMIISVCVVIGFKREVTSQVVGFGSHIQIFSYGSSSSSFERSPISIDDNTLAEITTINGINRVAKVVTKPGIVKTDDDFKGIIFKGVDRDYDWSFFRKNIVEGSVPDLSNSDNRNNIIVSSNIAKSLNLKVGDDVSAYFFQQQVRGRKFIISGIYSTTFSQFDDLFALCNSQVLQELNGWSRHYISSLEITITDFDRLDPITDHIRQIVGNKFDDSKIIYDVQSIKEVYPQIFNWLDMLNINAYIVIVLMLAVAGFNIVSGLLIIILEKTQTIGILKALGMKDKEIRKVFVVSAMFFVGRGMVWGNIIGFSIVVLQHFLHIVPLNPEYYYTSFVPVHIDFRLLIVLNLSVFLFSILIMVLPSQMISKILPAKSIKFE